MTSNADNAAPPERASAEIIAFPAHRRTKGPELREDAPPDAPIFVDRPAADRLQTALAGLIAAQAEQKAALERWQTALGNLQSGVNGLGQSLRGYARTLLEIAPPASRG
jgi:hypothetical protein